MRSISRPFRWVTVLLAGSPVLLGAMLMAGPAYAQPAPAAAPWAAPQNVLQLSASGQVEVQQDLLRLVLSTSREGADAASVQQQLREALDAALKAVKTTAEPGQMDVRTGNFNVHPRYDRDGKISGWQGSTDLALEGRDFPRITAAAARAGTLAITNVSFGLSRETRARVESEAQAQAIERFRARAAEIAKAFGFAGYTLREVNVDGGNIPMPVVAMARATSMKAEPVPVEPGTTTVQVTVSGSVQAH